MSLTESKQSNENPDDSSFLRNVFFSPSEPRLRAGWRMLVQILLMLAFYIPVLCVLSIPYVLLSNPSYSQLEEWLFIIQVIIALPAVLLATWIARRKLDHRSFSSLGFQQDSRTGLDLLAGFLIPSLMMAAVFLFSLIVGWSHFNGFGWSDESLGWTFSWILIYLVVFISVGFYEELLFRGYYLLNLRDGMNLGWAIVITSITFGFFHIMNPNSGLLPGLLTSSAGFFLAYAWFRTRSLWLPISLHVGWNFFLGPIFGFPVSGLNTPSLIEQTVTGPDWLSGGAYGPEGGLILFISLGVGFLLVRLYTHK